MFRFVKNILNNAQRALAGKKTTRFALAVLLALVCVAQGSNVSEYAVKADYLSNFAENVRWPKSAFADPGSPIVLGILGDDPFGKTLDDVVKGKTAAGHTLSVKRFGNFDKDQLDDLKTCQILFISDSEQDNVREILTALSGTHLLTVSEIDQFPKMGGIIQFTQDGDLIGLVINPKTAVSAGLRLSAELMKVSKHYMEVNAGKVKTLYYDGITLYINGDIKEAVRKWKECLDEDPDFMPAQEKITTARAKLRAISKIK